MHTSGSKITEGGFYFAPADDSGSGNGGTGDGGNENGNEGGDKGGDEKKEFSQAELNRIMAREKGEGKRAALREITEKLGIESLEEAQEILTKAREAEDKKKSETDRERERATREREEAEREKAEARRERLTARIERALFKHGVPEDELEDVSALVKVEDDADADAVQEAVEALKKRLPRLFAAPAEEEKPVKPKHGDTGPPPRTPSPKGTSDKARSILQERHGRKLTPKS